MKLESVFESDNSLYMILEKLSGGNLLEYLQHRKTVLSAEEIKTIMRHLLKGQAELE